MNLKMNTEVRIETPYLNISFAGIIVGKANNSISESYIIKCTDGFIPNDIYEYDTVIMPLVFINER